MDDDELDLDLTLFGARANRRRCFFCPQIAAVVCDGDRCIRLICDDHRWTAAPEFDLCPLCESKLCAVAAMPKQLSIFA